MAVNEICEKIIKHVCLSNLDFQINQTPYSLYFSIRKKFIKGYKAENVEYKDLAKAEEIKRESLENENIYMKQEYQKLYNLYENKLSAEKVLEEEIKKLEHEVKNLNGIKNSLVEVKNKFEKVCFENEQLRNEIVDLKKDKNSLSQK